MGSSVAAFALALVPAWAPALALASALVLAAGAGAVATTWPGARGYSAGAALLAIAAVLLWPLLRRPPRARAVQEPPPPPDPRPQALLQAQLDHLPVAAWVRQGRELRALSARAHRLAAPGGVRDAQALARLLREATATGPVQLDTERGSERWLLRRQDLALDGQPQTLLALVPLESELELETLVAWQQLVKVLTHEIMNSLTPIRSLSETARGLVDEPPSVEQQATLHQALEAIGRRAEGLASFVARYRRVSTLPPPVCAPADLAPLFARLQQAVQPAWAARGGQARFEVSTPGLRLVADEAQLEQALLALLRNAEQATVANAQPRLWVQARQGRGGRLQISVRDNGPGVPAGLERQIFLPFFSAREGGEGIGLAVVRQLVHGMGGRVRHVRPLQGGAAFVMSF